MGNLSLIFAFLAFNYVDSFPPQPDPTNTGVYTVSHRQITSTAIKRATVEFIRWKNLTDTDEMSPSEIYKTYFGTDGDSLQLFLGTIDSIVGYGNKIQRDMKSTAYYHVNGEQIEEAHNFIRSTFKSIREVSTLTPVDLEFIREKLGHIIYTIQSFYSNTNYVNLFGDQEYSDFGMEHVTLLPVSAASTHTCKECPYDKESYNKGLCENNLESKTELTSGYMSGQDIEKPRDTRKCSHGTMQDDTRMKTAKGGIYKGQSINVPHQKQHVNAYNAAIKAVHRMLINDGDQNLAKFIGADIFKEVLNIKSKEELAKTSLTFVIDVSGSMWDNIQGVQKATKEVIRKAQSSSVTPYNYILVTFNDPVSLQTEMKTQDAEELLSELDKLKANGHSGNTDCPEYALTGLKRGVEMSRDGASVFLCTDADAKDEDLMDEIIADAKMRAIKITFLLTGNCTVQYVKRRKRSLYVTNRRFRRSTSSIWHQIATQTGGAVYETPTSNLQTIVNTVVQDIYPSTFVHIQYMDLASQDNLNVSIPVDDAITSLHINVHGAASTTDINILYPNGTIVEPSTENITFTNVVGAVEIEIQDPVKGEWKLLGHQGWNINITANSMLDFTYSLLEKDSDNYYYKLSSNPIKNRTYTLSLETTAEDNVTVIQIEFFNVSYKKESVFYVKYVGSEAFADVHFTNSITMLRIVGIDTFGYNFVRTFYANIDPVQVELVLIPLTQNLRMNKNETINYSVKNAGSENASIVVRFTDNVGFLLPPTSNTHTLSPGEEALGTGYIYATATVIISYTITVEDVTSNTVMQKQTGKVMVSSVERPYCSVNETNGDCPSESLNTLNCSEYSWNSTLSVTFSHTLLSKISIHNAGSKTELIYWNLTDNQGPTYVWVRSDCCNPSIYVTAVDEDGFFTRCHILLAKDPVKYVVVTPKDDIVEDIATAVIVTVTTLAIVVFLCVLKNSYSSMKPWCRKLSQPNLLNAPPKRECRSSNVKFPMINNFLEKKL